MEIDSWYELKIENDRLNSKKIILKKSVIKMLLKVKEFYISVNVLFVGRVVSFLLMAWDRVSG